jgi:hypothetical protein
VAVFRNTRGRDGSVREELAAAVIALRDMMSALIDWLIAFPTEHPTLTGWFTSIVSGGVVVKALWSYWKRPIIWARLSEKHQSLAEVPFRLSNGTLCDSTYLRLSIKNGGLTTLKDCCATMTGVTVRPRGQPKKRFSIDQHSYGWSNRPLTKLDLRSKAEHTLDMAVLLKESSGGPSRLFWEPTNMPATLYNFLNPLSAASGETRYIFRVRVDAENENARSRTVPVEFLFDPSRVDLRFVPFNTRWPGWRLWRWLRAKFRLTAPA